MTELPYTELFWTKQAEQVLLGRTIVKVRYMTEAECNEQIWSHRAIVLELDNGVLVYPSRDDEGNDAGALLTSLDQWNGANFGIPTL